MEPFTVVTSWATPTSLFLLLNVVIGFIAVSSVFNSKKNGHPPPPDNQQDNNHQIYHQEQQQQQQRLARAPSLFSRVTSFKFCNAPKTENRPLIAPVPSFLSRVTSFNSLYFSRSGESEAVQVEESENSFSNSYLHRSVESETVEDEESENSYLHRSVESETVQAEELETNPLQSHPETENRQSITSLPSFLSRMTSFNSLYRHRSAEKSEESERSVQVEETEHRPTLLQRMASITLSLQRSRELNPEAEAEQQVTRSETEPKARRKKKVPTGKMKKSSSEKETTATIVNGEVDAQADDFINRFKQQLRLQRLDSLLRYRNSSG